jgi:hypothetical protein
MKVYEIVKKKKNQNIFITFLDVLGIFIEEEVIFSKKKFLSVCRLFSFFNFVTPVFNWYRGYKIELGKQKTDGGPTKKKSPKILSSLIPDPQLVIISTICYNIIILSLKNKKYVACPQVNFLWRFLKYKENMCAGPANKI